MIKRFIRRVLGLPSEDMQRVPRERHGLARERHQPRRRQGLRGAARGRLLRLRRGRRGARPAPRHRAEGLRHRHRRAPGAGQAALPPRAHHRPALSPGARDDRPRDGRGVDLPRRRHRHLGEGRARPRAARQRVRHAGRGRAAARLHRQRALLRPGHRGGGRLPRRARRPEEARAARDRRPRDALPRGSGAHAARRCGSRRSSA